jgi:hypothetical protein
MTKQKIITRVVLLVSLVSLFTDIASEMLYPVMPVFLKSIGFSVILISLLEGVAEATAGLSKGYFGNLSDKKGVRLPFVRWGYTLSAISKLARTNVSGIGDPVPGVSWASIDAVWISAATQVTPRLIFPVPWRGVGMMVSGDCTPVCTAMVADPCAIMVPAWFFALTVIVHCPKARPGITTLVRAVV